MTENAYVTLAKICLIHSQNSEHTNKFLAALPLQGEEEAQEAHEFLFQQVLSGNQLLLGACKANMLKAVMAIKTAHAENSDILTEEGEELMNKVLAMWFVWLNNQYNAFKFN